MEIPETRYARSGDVSIAYQILGDGPYDLVRIPPFVYHVELAWQIPSLAAFNRRLASLCRLITFDKRGTGMSDRVRGRPPSRFAWTTCGRSWTRLARSRLRCSESPRAAP